MKNLEKRLVWELKSEDKGTNIIINIIAFILAITIGAGIYDKTFSSKQIGLLLLITFLGYFAFCNIIRYTFIDVVKIPQTLLLIKHLKSTVSEAEKALDRQNLIRQSELATELGSQKRKLTAVEEKVKNAELNLEEFCNQL